MKDNNIDNLTPVNEEDFEYKEDENFSSEAIDEMVCNEENNETFDINGISVEHRKYFSKSYMSRITIAQIPNELYFKGDLSSGFSIKRAMEMPAKEAIAYAFYFASLNLKKSDCPRAEYEAARDFIVRVCQGGDDHFDMEVVKLAKNAFYFYFNGCIEMIVKKHYAAKVESSQLEDAVMTGVNEVWAYIYEKKLHKYVGQVDVTRFFAAYINSWLEEYDYKKRNLSRDQGRRDTEIKNYKKKFMDEQKREPTLAEIVRYTGHTIRKVLESKTRIEYEENVSSLESFEAGENLESVNIMGDRFETPEEKVIKDESLRLVYNALRNLDEIERCVYLACYGMDLYENGLDYSSLENGQQRVEPSKMYNKVATQLKMTAHDVEKTYRRAERKVIDFCGVRRNTRNEYITNQDVLLAFNPEEDNAWNLELGDISGFFPD